MLFSANTFAQALQRREVSSSCTQLTRLFIDFVVQGGRSVVEREKLYSSVCLFVDEMFGEKCLVSCSYSLKKGSVVHSVY